MADQTGLEHLIPNTREEQYQMQSDVLRQPLNNETISLDEEDTDHSDNMVYLDSLRTRRDIAESRIIEDVDYNTKPPEEVERIGTGWAMPIQAARLEALAKMGYENAA